MPTQQGFIAACGNGTVRLFEKSSDPKEVYKRAKRFKIADEVQNVVSLAVSPSEDSLVCTVASGQSYTLSLANSDIVKVRCVFLLVLTALQLLWMHDAGTQSRFRFFIWGGGGRKGVWSC
jgi:hypothetical protein